MTGVLLGSLFGLGVLVLIRGWRAAGPPPPMVAALHRVPGYEPLDADQRGTLAELLRPLANLAARLVGGRAAIGRRLDLAGDSRGVEAHLLAQAMWAGAFAAAALAFVIATGNAARPGAAVLAVGLAVIGGLLAGDFLLTRRVAARRDAIAEQFPVASQLIALLVAAGASPSDAVGRVAHAIGGPLGDLMAQAATRTASGQGFAASMRQFAAATDLPVIERFVFGLLSAIERGSPLSDLMRAQALDAAAESHRLLMVSAGRRDIAMLVPASIRESAYNGV